MALPYELMIGFRYMRTKRHNHFISFISLVSMLGVALGVMALIVVLSVMNGFQTELRTRILSVVSHIQISGLNGEMPRWESVAQQARQHSEVIAAAPFIQSQGMLSSGQTVRGTVVRGIIPTQEETVAEFQKHMKQGSFDSLRAGEFNILLGKELARALRVSVGSRVTLISPQGVVTPAGVAPRLKSFIVSGIFEIGMIEYDAGLALIDMQDAQRLYRMDDLVSGVRLKVKDLLKAPQITRDLAKMLDVSAFLTDWTRSHANLFRATQIEKNIMFIILSLIIAVAAFNIASTLVMTVTDKRADIAILRTLGASPKSIMKIFIVQGTLIASIGLMLGVASGVLLAINLDTVVSFIEDLFKIQFMSKDVYYISNLPSELQWRDVWMITGVSFVLSLITTLYPSYRASRVNPAEALRYE